MQNKKISIVDDYKTIIDLKNSEFIEYKYVEN